MQIRKKGRQWYFLRAKYRPKEGGTGRCVAEVFAIADRLSMAAVRYGTKTNVNPPQFTPEEAAQWKALIDQEHKAQNEALEQTRIRHLNQDLDRFLKALEGHENLLSEDLAHAHLAALKRATMAIRKLLRKRAPKTLPLPGRAE